MYVKMNVETDFVSVGCNRVVNALDWGEDDLIAYGAHHTVAIYSVSVRLSLCNCLT